jgi:hypothetical protein
VIPCREKLEIPPEDENVHADAARIYCGEEPNKFGSFWYPCVSTLNAEKKTQPMHSLYRADQLSAGAGLHERRARTGIIARPAARLNSIA